MFVRFRYKTVFLFLLTMVLCNVIFTLCCSMLVYQRSIVYLPLQVYQQRCLQHLFPFGFQPQLYLKPPFVYALFCLE